MIFSFSSWFISDLKHVLIRPVRFSWHETFRAFLVYSYRTLFCTSIIAAISYLIKRNKIWLYNKIVWINLQYVAKMRTTKNVLYITKWLWTDLGMSVWVTGILSNNMKFPSHECYITFFSLTKYNDNPQSIKLSTNLWPFYRTRPFTELWEVFIEYIWCGMGTGDAYSSRHMVPPHLGLAYALLVETNPFSELVVIFPDNAIQTSLGTFSILLLYLSIPRKCVL